MKTERNCNDDLIRVISTVFVIMIHTGGKPWSNIPILDAMVTTLIFFSNSFFYMLSGKYNIGKHFDTTDDYLVYYRKKFIDIILPYILVSMILSAWNIMLTPNSDIANGALIVYYIKVFLFDILSGNSSSHLWFMFWLIGFIISAPFLSKMMTNMSEAELNILFGAIIVWNFVTVFLFPFFDKPFSYNGWFITGWLIHFCMGYYVDRIAKSGHIKWLYFVGATGLILNIICMTFAKERFGNATDLQPTFIIACAGMMAFIEQKIKLKKDFAVKTVKFLAKYTFVAYMVHFNIANHVTPIITGSLPLEIRYCSSVIVTFFISFIASILLSRIINPCKKLFQSNIQYVLGQSNITS